MTDYIERLSPDGDLQGRMQEIGYSFPDAVVEGEPIEAGHVFYDRNIDHATIGIWESQAGVVKFDYYPFDELCVIVNGQLILEPVGGDVEQFGPGDVFIIKKGFNGLWKMPAPLKKFYAELKPYL